MRSQKFLKDDAIHYHMLWLTNQSPESVPLWSLGQALTFRLKLSEVQKVAALPWPLGSTSAVFEVCNRRFVGDYRSTLPHHWYTTKQPGRTGQLARKCQPSFMNASWNLKIVRSDYELRRDGKIAKLTRITQTSLNRIAVTIGADSSRSSIVVCLVE